jgi:hypothetical protein
LEEYDPRPAMTRGRDWIMNSRATRIPPPVTACLLSRDFRGFLRGSPNAALPF